MLKKPIIIWLITILGHHHFLVAQKVPQMEFFADSLAEEGRDLLRTREFDSAILVLSRSVTLNRELRRELELGQNQNDIGVAYHNLRKYDSAISYYNKAKLIFLQKEDTITLPITLANLGMLYKRSGKYEKALENLFTSLSYNLSIGTKASTLNTIGSTYTQTGQYDLSVEYYRQAIHYYTELGNQRRLGIAFNNIGNAYNKLRTFDSAITYLNRAIVIKRSLGDQAGLARSLNNLGLLYLDSRDFSEAERILSESLQLKRLLSDSLGIANTLNLVSRINLRNGHLEEAKRNLDVAFSIIENVGALYELRENLKWKAEYYAIRGDRLNESKVLRQYIHLNDSLLDLEKVRSLAEMQVKYESEKKDDEISYLQDIEILQNSDLTFQRSLKNIYLISASLLGFSLIIVVFLLIANRRRKAKIENLNLEMQHRIKNNLQILSGILKLQGHSEKEGETISLLRESEGRVNAMAIVHQLLYIDRNRREIEIREYASELCEFLKKSFSHRESDLLIDTDLADIWVDVDQIISIGLIINELVTNAIKHAFIGIPNPEIHVQFLKMDSGNYLLQVRDNGVGLGEEGEMRTRSFGIKLIHMLAKQLNAELNVFNDRGAVYQFSIPPK